MTSRATPAAKAANAPVLLIEDTASLAMVYRSVLTSAGHRVLVAGTAAEGLTLFRDRSPSVVLLDLLLPDRNGLELMQDFLALRPSAAIIVITANGSIAKAVEAMRAGAHEFLVKPFDEQRLLAAVENAARPRPVVVPPPAVPRPVSRASSEAFIGSSPVMDRIHATIRSVASSMATVFITGESGTGKELCALAVHDNSARASGPFIALNCGAIPQDLLESEVFGHMKGSFTGAVSDKPGAATAADGGTLFLDEVCEMAPALQTKLLRFLQTSTVQPVGATRPRKVNVRIICATNRDPADAVRRGQFREDLYYRLYVVPIHMPPLRERGNDVIEIAEAALSRFGAEEGRAFDGLAPQVANLFRRLPWPGNVRQVLNVIRNVVVLNEGGLVTPDMLPAHLADQDDAPEPLAAEAPAPQIDSLIGLTLAEIERQVIEATIARHGGSVPKAARVLDIAPSTLYRKREGWAQD
ncbi:sigma-54-dependent transcriptional regulator [Rhodobacter ferrooxidans]|uniref:Nif-specific regulatory protein n=1 Tax=Rhodobacter ferrooxidans TaxID=371731 RepID=C8S3F5_9RHOB|nr:sigma-54 dependent transcriptional regulator [Rhodobacter sp. SW2]EEW24520.1 two component, sigma54 specific, transcriptional regulator, Fis family [Rhodobacter sp. SW2]